MKKIILLVVLSLSCCVFGQAPNIEWQKALGGTSYEYAQCTQLTQDGGFIVAGYAYSTDGDITGNHGSFDVWVVKLSATGSLVWQKTLGGTGDDRAYSIQPIANGGYLIAGDTNSNDGDVTGNHGGTDAWVVKLSSNGAIEWQKALGGTFNDGARSTKPTADGGSIVAGYTKSISGDVTGNHGDKDAWIVKLSASGDLEWQKTLGGANEDFANSIQTTSDGGYIVACSNFSGGGGDVTGNHGGYDAWIVKLSASGVLMWQKTLGGFGQDFANSITSTSDGGYMMVGTNTSNGGSALWVLKLSSSGALLWQETLEGGLTEAYSVQPTADGGYIVAAVSSSNGTYITGNHGGSDFAIVKLSASGVPEWQKPLGGTGEDLATSIQPTADGGYIVAGYASSNDEDVIGNHGSSDFWVVKLAGNVVAPTAPTASAQIFCNGAIVGSLVAAGTSLKWYDLATNGSPLTSNTVLVSGTYYVSQTIDGIESDRTSVLVTVNVTPSPTGTEQIFNSSSTVADLVATGTDLKWYTVATGESILNSSTPLATGTYYVSQTLNGCESARISVSVINIISQPSLNTTAPEASTITSTSAILGGNLTLDGNAPIINKGIVYNTTGNPTSADNVVNVPGFRMSNATTSIETGPFLVTLSGLNSATTFYAKAYASNSVGVTYGQEISFKTLPSKPTANAQTFCFQATVANLAASGTDLKWYDIATNGLPLPSNTVLVSGSYYVSQTINGVESDRTAVTIMITPQPIQPTIACYQSATFSTTSCTWDVAGTQPTQPTLACYETATFNDSTCSWDVTGTQPVQQTLACYQSATFNTTSCSWDVSGTQPTQPTLACFETVTFNDSICSWDVTGTQPIEPTLACYESAIFNNSSCSWNVTGTVPAVPIGDAVQTLTVVLLTDATITNLIVNPTNVIWYASLLDAQTGTNPLLNTIVLTDGATYYAVNTENGCLSTPLEVTVSVTLGTATFSSKLIQIYPNPTSSILNIQTQNNTQTDKIIIIDLTGKKVLEQNNANQVNVANLAKGFYVVEAFSGEEKWLSKFVKE